MMGKERSAYIGCFYSLVGIVLLLIAALVLGACRSVRYIPVESVRHDSVVTILHHRDSIYQHDSILIKEKADTLLIERWHTRWRDKVSQRRSVPTSRLASGRSVRWLDWYSLRYVSFSLEGGGNSVLKLFQSIM